MSRYDRQQRIDNWKQESIDEAKVAVIGASKLGTAMATVLAGLGIGNTRFYGTKEDRNKLMFCTQQAGVRGLEEMVKNVNNLVSTRSIRWRFTDANMAELIGQPDVIAHCSNDCFEKLVIAEYGMKNNIPVVSGASSKCAGALSVLNKGKDSLPESYLLPDFHRVEQGYETSMVIAGLMADEIRKEIMPLYKDEKPLDGIIHYNMESLRRFSKNKDFQWQDYSKDKTIYMVGAGSTGCVVALALGAVGIKRIVLFDDDTVETANLNRQVLHWDAVGRKKVESLAEKLQQMGVEAIPVDGRFSMDSEIAGLKPDLIMACTDSFRSRKIMDEYAKKYNVPLISGGTAYDAGQVVSYIPGKTRCLDCIQNIKERAAEEEERERHSCIHVPEPSVIVSNWIIASLMVAEAGAIFNTDNMPINGKLAYDSKQPRRMGLVKNDEACKCHEAGKEEECSM
ncbi:MAG: ThiF family adenylyltransferase [Candidatus Woesearchaeota archaeon]